MKEKLNKEELIKVGFEVYSTKNPKVLSSQLIKYRYKDKYLYQPWFYNIYNRLMTDRNGYWSIEEAKKVIDAYGI